jgi:hypothetical protein
VTLELTDGQPTGARQVNRYLTNFTQRVRDYRKAHQVTLEYYLAVEFKNGQPHMHVAVITSLDLTVCQLKALVRQWWSSSCPERQMAVHCTKVCNVIGLANYLPKFVRDRRLVEMPPQPWSSYTCRLVWYSRGFFAKKKTTLWREQLQEWYPPRQTP